jgi:hypothetical protein
VPDASAAEDLAPLSRSLRACERGVEFLDELLAVYGAELSLRHALSVGLRPAAVAGGGMGGGADAPATPADPARDALLSLGDLAAAARGEPLPPLSFSAAPPPPSLPPAAESDRDHLTLLVSTSAIGG